MRPNGYGTITSPHTVVVQFPGGSAVAEPRPTAASADGRSCEDSAAASPRVHVTIVVVANSRIAAMDRSHTLLSFFLFFLKKW